MNFEEAKEYLYSATPQFQRIGAAAYKPGLDTARALSDAFGNPAGQLTTIHVAGTNGKGSTCHTLAAILAHAGYRTGLYTSPHLVNFRERIRVNGQMIPKNVVAEFVEHYKAMNLPISPSFFELTTILAFDWFRRSECDVAVIETGLGGRLDTTNIISPVLSIITNISFDHKAQLGNTLALIASEKAGIIKAGTPVVIGNDFGEGVREVFESKAASVGSPIIFANELDEIVEVERTDNDIVYITRHFGRIMGELTGDCQEENTATVLAAVEQLCHAGFSISDDDVRYGFANVMSATGLAGRWMTVSDNPTVICDVAHNEGGWKWLAPRLERFGSRLTMVVGFVNDKDVDSILKFFPTQARYVFTQASIPRAMAADEVALKAQKFGLSGLVCANVADAYSEAIKNASADDVIFVGGSTFVVADLLMFIERQ